MQRASQKGVSTRWHPPCPVGTPALQVAPQGPLVAGLHGLLCPSPLMLASPEGRAGPDPQTETSPAQSEGHPLQGPAAVPSHGLESCLSSVWWPCALLSRVQLFATPWTAARQAPLSVGFSRQEHCSGWPCPPPGDLPHPGIEPASLMSPALTGGFFIMSTTFEAQAGCLYRFPKLGPPLFLSTSLPACPALSRPSRPGSAQSRGPVHLHPPCPSALSSWLTQPAFCLPTASSLHSLTCSLPSVLCTRGDNSCRF